MFFRPCPVCSRPLLTLFASESNATPFSHGASSHNSSKSSCSSQAFASILGHDEEGTVRRPWGRGFVSPCRLQTSAPIRGSACAVSDSCLGRSLKSLSCPMEVPECGPVASTSDWRLDTRTPGSLFKTASMAASLARRHERLVSADESSASKAMPPACIEYSMMGSLTEPSSISVASSSPGRA